MATVDALCKFRGCLAVIRFRIREYDPIRKYDCPFCHEADLIKAPYGWMDCPACGNSVDADIWKKLSDI